VLDRLLEDERLLPDGISGASAGAVNAVLVAHGLARDGRAGARAALRAFWESLMTAMPSSAAEAVLPLARFLAPYQLNPFNLNPLRELLARQIDFEALRRDSPVRVFVSATDVFSGMPRIFGTSELTLETLLASTCLPSFNQAVAIGDSAYWDGGLTANPPLRPLVYQCDATDILIVRLQPERRANMPRTAEEIRQRFDEISFSSTLHSEIQGIVLAKREAERLPFTFGRLERRLCRLNLHAIGPSASMADLDATSRMKTGVRLLEALYREGREQASAWLEAHFELIGVRSTLSGEQQAQPAHALG
jgi:NTE family protein